AMLQKNIARALFNRGQYAESVEYFDKVLAFHGETTPKHPIPVAFKFGTSYLAFLVAVYFPFLRWKKAPTQKDKEIISLFHKKLQALGTTDPREFFIRAIQFLKRIAIFDMNQIENGTGLVAAISILFSYSGLSFKLSRKVIEFIRDKLVITDVKSVLIFKASELFLNLASGNWPENTEYDRDLLDRNLEIGEFFYTTSYIAWNTYYHTARGEFDAAKSAIQKLSDITESYDNDFAKQVKLSMNTYFLMKYRKLEGALDEAEAGILFVSKTGFRVWLIGLYSY